MDNVALYSPCFSEEVYWVRESGVKVKERESKRTSLDVAGLLYTYKLCN